MGEQADKAFIKNFSLIMVGLVLFTFVIIFLARFVGFKEEADIPSQRLLTEERVRPVGDVYTEKTGAPEMVTTAVAQQDSAKPKVAFDGSLDAEMIYTSVCSACHTTGAAGAPQPGTPAMDARAENGVDALVNAAISGLNAMPARGGRPDLSDEQVRVAVEYMLQ